MKQFLDVVLKYPVSFTNISCNKLNNMEVMGGVQFVICNNMGVFGLEESISECSDAKHAVRS